MGKVSARRADGGGGGGGRVGIVSSCPARPGPRTLGHRASRQCVRARTFASPVASGVPVFPFVRVIQSVDRPAYTLTHYILPTARTATRRPNLDRCEECKVRPSRWLHGFRPRGSTRPAAGRKVR